MSNIVTEDSELFVRNLLKFNKKYEEIEEYAKQFNVPIVDKEIAEFLSMMIKIKKPKSILEVGTAIGYSSIVMANSYDACKITTMEKDLYIIEIAKKFIDIYGFKERIQIVAGDAIENLKKFNTKIDFAFIDASKGHYYEFFELIDPILNNEGIILCDNILFHGMVIPGRKTIRRKRTIITRLNNFLNYVMKLKNYKVSILPVSDGIAILHKEN